MLASDYNFTVVQILFFQYLLLSNKKNYQKSNDFNLYRTSGSFHMACFSRIWVSHQYHSGYNPDHYIDAIFKVEQTSGGLLITHGHILNGLCNFKPFVFLLAVSPISRSTKGKQNWIWWSVKNNNQKKQQK